MSVDPDVLATRLFTAGPSTSTATARRPSVRAARKAPTTGQVRLKAAPRPRSRRFLTCLVVMALTATGTWWASRTLIGVFEIPSASMEPTLDIGDKVVVERASLLHGQVHRGDIVVFTDPAGWLTRPGVVQLPPTKLSGLGAALVSVGLAQAPRDDFLIKRVIGVAGDTVRADGTGPVYVNDIPLGEPYLPSGVLSSSVAFSVTVPAGMVWVMGDNREHSADSRFNQDDSHGGAVPVADVYGVAKVLLWPTSRAARLTSGETAIAAQVAPTGH